MIDRSQIQTFLRSIGHEAASQDQPSLCLAESIVNALGEVTEEMIEEGAYAIPSGQGEEEGPPNTRDARECYRAMFTARFGGE